MDFDGLLARCPERRCDTGAGVVAYREAGAGVPVVLLHGISSGAASWVAQLAGLEDGFRVIAWDAPGYGASSRLEPDAPLASDYAHALGRLVDALGLEHFALVGHSLGALMAAAYAAAEPRRVRRLLLLSPARGYAEADAAERERRFAGRMAMLDRLGPDGLARARAGALLSPDASPDALAWVARNMRRLDPAGYRQAARMLADDDIGRYARHWRRPVAVLSGSADGVTPVDQCRRVAGAFERATYEVLPGLGHALYVEAPDRINACLRQQLAAASADGMAVHHEQGRPHD